MSHFFPYKDIRWKFFFLLSPLTVSVFPFLEEESSHLKSMEKCLLD